ncbi:MAG: type II secretion system protein N [Burkholderiaceae bacterium]|nr:type II secretion system protein N [Burkholderiaceae bacterium]
MALNWRRSARQATRWPGSGYAESTLAQVAWERTRKAVARWGWAGLLCGAAVALVAFAPATWLADTVAAGTRHRLLLADARGTVWNGSAVAVLSGGPDSRSAAMLPGRTSWRIGLSGLALELRLRQPCCTNDDVVLLLRPGLGQLTVQLMPGSGQIGEWPAAWLAGLGAPWNTLQLGGALRLSSRGMSLQWAAGRWSLQGQADLELSDVASALTTLDRLGSYRLHLEGTAGRPPTFTLSTQEGALLINGSGQWTGSQLRFRGEARAAPGAEGELDNLLNFFGRRQGALSLISIG